MSFIDLMGTTVWTDEQIDRYGERLIANQFSSTRRRQLDDLVLGEMLGEYTLTPEETSEVQIYKNLRLQVRADIAQARIDNARVAAVCIYEQQVRRKASLHKKIFGVEAAEAVTDEETGEIITPAVEEVLPMPQTIEVEGETVDNPEFIEAGNEYTMLGEAIDNTPADIKTLAEQRIS